MRKILFRGKSNTDVWVYGSLVYSDNIQPAIYFETGKGKLKSFEQVYVDPKTIGQFTGLTDKSEKEIFEGDILHSVYQDKAEPSGVGHIYNEVAFREGAFGWIGEITNDFFPFDGSEIKEGVIGNIHDNPELLNK